MALEILNEILDRVSGVDTKTVLTMREHWGETDEEGTLVYAETFQFKYLAEFAWEDIAKELVGAGGIRISNLVVRGMFEDDEREVVVAYVAKLEEK